MAQHARTTGRASETLLETATLLLAALTALTVIARHAAEMPASDVAPGVGPAAALRRPAPAIGPAAGTDTAEEAERQAVLRETLRDMLLHD